MAQGSSGGWKKLAVNIAVPLLVVTVSYTALEIWARCKYYKGSIKQKCFASRGKELTKNKHTSVRIVCIGGSATHGGGNLQDNETYPYFLEEMINKKLGTNYVEVINSGLPARVPEYQRDFIIERIGDQEVDMIIWDPINAHFFPFLDTGENVEKILTEHGFVKNVYSWDKMTLRDVIHVFLSEHSYLYIRLNEKLLRMCGQDLNKYYAQKKDYIKGEAKDVRYKVVSKKEQDDVLTLFLNRFYSMVKDVIDITKAHNVKLVLLVPPYPISSKEFAEHIDELRPKQYYNIACEKAKQILMKMSERYGVQVIDADDAFTKIGMNIEQGSVHLSREGYYLLAGVIADNLIPRLKENEPISRSR